MAVGGELAQWMCQIVPAYHALCGMGGADLLAYGMPVGCGLWAGLFFLFQYINGCGFVGLAGSGV